MNDPPGQPGGIKKFTGPGTFGVTVLKTDYGKVMYNVFIIFIE